MNDRLSRRDLLKGLGAGAVLLGGMRHLPTAWAAQAASTAAASGARPNFVFILMDDMGWMDLSCQGSKYYRSPNIDKLASQSMRFSQAYAACPVCSPTRASIMTGRYPATVNLTDYIPGHQFPWAKFLPPKFNQSLPFSEATIAQALKDAGYITACMGKWHLGTEPASGPDKYGFDVVVGKVANDDDKQAGALTVEACKFVQANKDRPFFLYLAHHAVHLPLQAKPELVEKYKDKAPAGSQQNNPLYAGMIDATDQTVGTLMAKLDELKLADNTVVIFMSDNGGLLDYSDGRRITSNAPLRGGKGMLYEGGIREPLFIRWPGKIQPGTCDVPVCSVDFFPTMLEIAGVKVEAKNPIDGLSIVPLLEQRGKLADRALYWHYPHYHRGKPSGAIREGDWKLIESFEDGHVELYNLKDDLSETNDLAAKMPDRAADLQKKLAAWRKKVNAQMMTANPNYDPARADKPPDRPAGAKAPVEE